MISGIRKRISELSLELREILKKISHVVLMYQKVRLRGKMTHIDSVFHNLWKMNRFHSATVFKSLEEIAGRKTFSRSHKTSHVDLP